MTLALDPAQVCIAPAGADPADRGGWTAIGHTDTRELLYGGRRLMLRVIRCRPPTCQDAIDAMEAYAQRERIGHLLVAALLVPRPLPEIRARFSPRR